MADRQLDPVKMRAWRSFLEAHAAITRTLEQELRTARDLPLSWYDVLVQLNEAGRSLRMHELAASLLISRSATTRFVDRLEAAGLLARTEVTEDRRGTEVRLTERGLEVLRHAAPVHLRGVKQHFGDRLSCEEAEQLLLLMGKLSAAGAESLAGDYS